MTTETASRAGEFLDRAFFGPSKNKRIAQWASASPEMAKLLRRGEGWTVARLDHAAKTFGAAFREFVFQVPSSQPDMLAELAHLRAEITAQREEIAHVSDRLAALSMAPLARQESDSAGGEGEPPGRVSRSQGYAARRSAGSAP